MNITKDYNLDNKTSITSDIEELSLRYLSLKKFDFRNISIPNYELIEIIGKGGFGIVFKAFSKIQKKHIALKFLDPETNAKEDSYRRVIREINNAQKIKDKRIVSIYSIEDWNGIIFLVMELYEGKTLKEYLKDKNDWTTFKSVFLDILEAVKVLHDNNIVHRDLKPSNVFITKDDQVVLLDFGLSKKLDEQTATITTDKILGTIAFLSPEQLTPEISIDHRSDIYQLGLILYISIYGKLPFEGDTASIMTKKLYSRPEFPPLPEVKPPKYMIFGIEKALEKDTSNRFESISDMKTYFVKSHYPFFGRTIQTIKKKPKTTIFTIILLILISFLFYFFMSNNHEIDRVEYNGSNLKAYNPFGMKLFEREFKDKEIKYASKQYLGFISSQAHKQLNPQNTVLTFLEPKSKKPYPDFQSYLNNYYDVSMSFYDNSGALVNNERGTSLRGNLFYDFSKSFKLKLAEKTSIINSNVKLITFIRTHYYGMFPTSIYFKLKNGRTVIYNNPGQFLYYKIKKELYNPIITDIKLSNRIDQKYIYRFILYGRNNIMSHLNFFAETSNLTNQHNFIPNLHKSNLSSSKTFLIFLPFPIYVLKDKWFTKEGYIEFDNRINKSIINVSKNKISVKTEKNTTIYKDEKTKLDIIYENINSYYKEKMLRKNYQKGAMYLQTALNQKPENPWLHSALLYLLGDLYIRDGNYEEGLKSLINSLKLYSYNVDSYQRICEVNFLLNKKEELKILIDNNKANRYHFFGLGNGFKIFKIYTYLHLGKIFKAETIVERIVKFYERSLNQNSINGNPLLKVIYNIFTGDYKVAVLISENLRGQNFSPFSLNEYRLFYSRSAILSNMYDKEKPKEPIMKLTRFYIEDISKNSITLNHQADISRAYFFALDGKSTKAQTLINSGYKELLKMNKGDFFTRLWFFYDMFIYGKTNELLGNKEEAIKGYKASIKVNPHTDLAKRAERIIKRLQN